MKLLFDQNLSFRIITLLGDQFKESRYVKQLNLIDKSDIEIWQYAKQHGYTIVTQDADFIDISALRGRTPKVIWIRTGNASTAFLAQLLQDSYLTIKHFIEEKEESLLELSSNS